jgi:hypothetical protein
MALQVLSINGLKVTCRINDSLLPQERLFLTLTVITLVYLKDVLDPLLILLYIHDIGGALPASKVKLFVNDINLFVRHANMVAFSEWFLTNKLTKNTLKTCYM